MKHRVILDIYYKVYLASIPAASLPLPVTFVLTLNAAGYGGSWWACHLIYHCSLKFYSSFSIFWAKLEKFCLKFPVIRCCFLALSFVCSFICLFWTFNCLCIWCRSNIHSCTNIYVWTERSSCICSAMFCHLCSLVVNCNR